MDDNYFNVSCLIYERTIILFYSPKESSLSIVGPLGLSGSLFLGLLVLDFYHPTNRTLYSPKESALALTVWVPLVRVALISLVYWSWIFTTL